MPTDDQILATRILERLGYAVDEATHYRVKWVVEEIEGHRTALGQMPAGLAPADKQVRNDQP